MASISVDALARQVSKILEEQKNVTEEALHKAVDETTKTCVKEIRANAKSQFGGSGEYASSWTSKKESDGKEYSRVIYAKGRGARLSHLLEKGHAKVNGGRVAGRAHIAPAEENAKTNLIKNLKEGIE